MISQTRRKTGFDLRQIYCLKSLTNEYSLHIEFQLFENLRHVAPSSGRVGCGQRPGTGIFSHSDKSWRSSRIVYLYSKTSLVYWVSVVEAKFRSKSEHMHQYSSEMC